jgi:secreted trypsin-like serine protease
MMSSRRRAIAGLAILAIAASAAAAASPALAGKASRGARAHSSIVGGGPANPTDWPFVVTLYRKNRLHCGGSLITPTKVLTAAHCVEGFNLSNFAVIVGRPDLKNTSAGVSIAIAAGATHPDFATTGMHDMAVLTLAQPTNTTPVTLATQTENDTFTVVGSQLSVAGWGAQNPLGFKLSPILKTTIEQIRNTKKCIRAYTKDIFNPVTMICALGHRIPKFKRPPIDSSACSGDSGGPLVANTSAGVRQVGIVSYGGAFCGLPASPTVYTRVTSGLEFIAANG